MGHMIWAATEANPSTTILSVDGVEAYDHVRSAPLGIATPNARSRLPFVRLSYARPSNYIWFDEQGVQHTVNQAEGGEQGDRNDATALCSGHSRCIGGGGSISLAQDKSCALFFGDAYVVCQPDRVKVLFVLLSEVLLRPAGIELY